MKEIPIPDQLLTSENIAIVALSFMVALLTWLLVTERRDRKQATEGLIEIGKALSGLETAIKLLSAKL